MNIYSLLDPFSPNVLVHAHFQLHESIFSCMHLLLVAPSHMVRSCPKSLARVQPIRASRPNCGRVLIKSCTTIKPSRAPFQAEASRTAAPRARPSRRHGPPRRGPDTRTPPCRRPTRALGRANTRALGRADARHEHSAVHTPDTSTRPCIRPTRASTRPHNLAQVTLDLLCSTLSYMKIMFCFYLYTSRLSAGLIMWDNSQFMFCFIFSSTFILT